MATIKQKLAFQKVLKGAPISKAMKEVGYASSTSKTTGKLTNSDGWQELLNKFVPDERLAKSLQEGLEATKLSGTGGMILKKSGDDVTEMGHSDLEVPDYGVRHKYLETGLKLRGRLKEKDNGGNTTNNILTIIAGEQLRRVAARVLDGDSASEGEPHRLLDSDEPEV